MVNLGMRKMFCNNVTWLAGGIKQNGYSKSNGYLGLNKSTVTRKSFCFNLQVKYL